MKWYQQYSNQYRDSKVRRACGSNFLEGMGFYITLKQMIADNYEGGKPEVEFEFAYLKSILAIKSIRTLDKHLRSLRAFGLIKYEKSDETVTILMPEIEETQDNYTKKCTNNVRTTLHNNTKHNNTIIDLDNKLFNGGN